VTERTAASDKPETLDELVAALHALRIGAGSVTYDELGARITRLRESRGLAPAAARVARSTVYDAFRSGRTRINADLLADIVTALGEDDAAVSEWRLRCMRVRLSQAPGRVAVPPSLPLAPHVLHLPHEPRPSAAPMITTLVMLVCLGLNLFGNAASARLNAPLFLDMIGTAIVAITFGPWFGAAVALSTNVLAGLSNSPQALPFVLVNIAGALVWGYGVRTWGLGRTPLRFFSLNVIAAVACTLTAAPILALNLSGITTNSAAGGLFVALQGPGLGLWGAALASNLTVSLGDKLLAGYVALAVAAVLARPPASHLSVRNPLLLWNLVRRREAPAPSAATTAQPVGPEKQVEPILSD
jgi:energy-coupling factor transport system substrate-specific component